MAAMASKEKIACPHLFSLILRLLDRLRAGCPTQWKWTYDTEKTEKWDKSKESPWWGLKREVTDVRETYDSNVKELR